MLRLPRIIPIRLVQIKIDVPRYGPSTLEPTISKIITTAPHKNTTISRKNLFNDSHFYHVKIEGLSQSVRFETEIAGRFFSAFGGSE